MKTGQLPTCRRLELSERPGRESLFRWLNKSHKRKLVRRSGRGVTSDPWRYRHETAAICERDKINEAFPMPDLPPLGDWHD